jgi:flagellar motor protein MotB
MAKEDPPKPKASIEKPEPPRRGFPIRLMLWAIVTTASTGGLAYFAFKYREDGQRDHRDLSTCRVDLAKTTGERDVHKSDLDTCSEGLSSMTATVNVQGDKLRTAEEQRKATEKILADAKERLAAFKEIQEVFAQMVDTGQLTLKPRRGMLVVGVDAEVLFESGSAKLSEKGELAVLEVGLILKGLKHSTQDRRFLVVGHTDATPLIKGKFADNLELSAARGLTVTRFLIKAGMNPASLISSGAGDSDPVGDNLTPEGQKLNRRIEIVVLPAVNDLPPLPNAEKAPEPTPP